MNSTWKRSFAMFLSLVMVIGMLPVNAFANDGEGEHTHVYTETVTAAATCTDAGVKTFTCDCGDSYTEEITAAHSYSGVVTDPTCEAAGYTTYTCACGDSYTSEEVAANGHSYGEDGKCACGAEKPTEEHTHSFSDGTVTTEATCANAGVLTKTCDCGEEETEVIPATGNHVYENGACVVCTAAEPVACDGTENCLADTHEETCESYDWCVAHGCDQDNGIHLEGCPYTIPCDLTEGCQLIKGHWGECTGMDTLENEGEVEVSTKQALMDTIYRASADASDNITIKLTDDIDYGTDHLEIAKPITLNLGGHTLTTRARNYGIALKNANAIVTNGKLNHAGTVAAIKVWNAKEISNLEIDVTGTSSSGNTIDGIVVQEGTNVRVDSIKNVKIYSTDGQGVDSGIKTYNCGNASSPVIGTMDTVTVNAKSVGLNISAPCGTATNCSISGGKNGIEISIKGTYSASLDLVDCEVTGGVYAHDELKNGVTNSGTLSLTMDDTTKDNVGDDIALTIMHDSAVDGDLADVKTDAAAKIGDNTYYTTLDAAFAAATDGNTIVLLKDATPDLTSQRAITKASIIDLNSKTLTLTEDDLYFGTTTFKNGNIVVDPSVKPSTAVFWMFANQTLTFDNVKLTATGVTGTYLIGLEGNDSNFNLLNGSEIIIDNSTALDLDVVWANGTNNDILIDDSKVSVTNLDGRAFACGNVTVSGDSEIFLSGITKAGFRIEGGEKLEVLESAKVTIVGEPRDGGINLLNLEATYTKADTATVEATVKNSAHVAYIGDVGYATFKDALEKVNDKETITLMESAEGTSEQSTEIDFTKAISFTITGKAPNYALPVVTFQNATVNIQDAEILIPELDARQNATINVINSKVLDAGDNSIVKSYYNGKINITDSSTVYTMQVTTMGYINISGGSQLNATWQTNVYGNGQINVTGGATFKTAAIHLTGQDYSGRDNTDADRVGKPANVVVDGATLIVGNVQSSSGADYSYNSSKGINVGTVDGKTAVLDIKNGATVSVQMANGETMNIGNGGTVNVSGGTMNVVCRGTGAASLVNNGAINVTGGTVAAQNITNNTNIYVTGNSDISANVTGAGWVYVNGVTMSNKTNLTGAKVGFINGTNSIVGSTIDDGWFSVGIGQNAAATTAAEFATAKGITLGDVTVNVSGDAVIGSNGADYSGWVGSAYSADKTAHKYVLNVNNSLATFGYMHVSKDGTLNVTGHSSDKYTYDNANVDFYAGNFIINGIVTLDGTDAWVKFTKMSVDHADGILNITNGTKYEASIHNGSTTSTTLRFWQPGEINVKASTMEIDNGVTLVEGAKLTADMDSTVTAATKIMGNGQIVIDAENYQYGDPSPVVGQVETAEENISVINNDYVKAKKENDNIILTGPAVYALDKDGNVVGGYENFEKAIAAASADASITEIEVQADITQNAVENTEDYYYLPGNLTISAPEGEEYTVSAGIAICVKGNGASLTIAENVTLEGLDVVANGFSTSNENMTINGKVDALSLKQWTSNGSITVNSTGSVTLGHGDGQLDLAYGNGSLTVNGNRTSAPEDLSGLTAQFKAGYSGTRGNGNTLNLNGTYFEGGAWFTIAGSNGTFNVDKSVLKVSGGDGVGRMEISSTGNVVNLTDGSRLIVANITLGAGNTISVSANSKLEATNISGAGEIVIDANGMTEGKVANIIGNLAGFTGTVKSINNDALMAVVVDDDTAATQGVRCIKLVPVVATVDGEPYATLQDAVNNANGKTVTLMNDTAEVVNIPSGSTLTIDLNEKTLTGRIKAPNATLTVENGSIKNTDSGDSAIEINAGTLNLNGVDIESARHAVRIDGPVTAIIDGGTYKVSGTAGKTTHAVNVSGAADVTIKNGEFIGPRGTVSDSGAAVNVQTGAKVTIEGGNFSGGKNNTLASKGTLTLTGGTYDQDPSDYCAPEYVAKENTNGKWEVITAGASITTAEGTTTYYYSLADAAAAAAEMVGEVTITRLNDNSGSNAEAVPVYGPTIIEDLGEDYNLSLILDGNDTAYVYSDGTVEVMSDHERGSDYGKILIQKDVLNTDKDPKQYIFVTEDTVLTIDENTAFDLEEENFDGEYLMDIGGDGKITEKDITASFYDEDEKPEYMPVVKQGERKTVIAVSTGFFDSCTEIWVDSERVYTKKTGSVNESYFRAYEGCTELELTGQFVKTLPAGKHSVKFVHEIDGKKYEPTIYFKVTSSASKADPTNPKTGDSIMMAVSVMTFSAAALAVLLMGKKKRA